MPFSSARPRRASGKSRFRGLSARRRQVMSARGPPGNTRRSVSRFVREMPVRAPAPSIIHEMKYKDVDSATYVADTTGAVTYLTSISGGDSMVTRQGARIRLCGTQVRGKVVAGTAGTLAQATLVLVYDRQANGAAPAITDVYETANSASFQAVINRSRFAILGHWTYTIVGNSTTPTSGREEALVDLKTVYDLPTVFNDAGAAAITNLISGSLHMLTFGDTAAGTGAPNFTVQVRTYFADN